MRKLSEKRLIREQITVQKMIALYCQAHHSPEGGLCDSCQELSDYALARIDACPFKENKPTCVKCPVHCYQRQRREQIREVMRYAGPRMLFRHPWLAMMHLIDGIRKP